MLLQRFYYALKPFLPWRLRMMLRRIAARRKRRACQQTWPINSATTRPPHAWPGWPDGKQFAFIVTHDVEGPEGVAKCRQLAEMELSLGIRSSFNFIPAGPYSVPADLRSWLVENGFEIGVHDLHHDGKLFDSRRGFQAKAVQINRYLQEWDAVGFRAGFMLGNLDWLRDLDILYDSSTFDTDPFEFQPEGANTIFPFWVPSLGQSTNPFEFQSGFVTENRPKKYSANGYVELPYTLPQDSTLFLVLQERTADIWKRKLDWLAAQGGMALVNVHPDYIAFTDASGPREYPVALYSDLLTHLSTQHGGRFWNPLPKEVASWYRQSHSLRPMPSVSTMSRRTEGDSAMDEFRGKRIAVLLYSSYPADPRPRRAAEALVRLGAEVEVICLRPDDREAREEIVNGVHVRRFPLKHRRGGKLAYLWQYSAFLLASFFILGRRSLGKRYHCVHVHNMPDILVFSALIPKLRGARIVLDLHDPMPELMMTIFGSKANGGGTKILKFLEKLSIGFADAVITVNETCKNIFSARSCAATKVHVVMNSPDENIFRFRDPADPPKRDRFVIMYHGSLVERHGLDLAVTALGKIRRSIPSAELRVYGQKTPYLAKVLESIKGTGLAEAVHYLGPKNLPEIVAAISECDVGVIPNRRSIFTEINTPTRIFEYLSQAKPVIAPRAQGILDYFGPDDLVYFELGDADDLAEKLEMVYRQPEAMAATVLRGQEIYRDHIWSRERERLIDVFAGLLGIKLRARQSPPILAGPTLRGEE